LSRKESAAGGLSRSEHGADGKAKSSAGAGAGAGAGEGESKIYDYEAVW